MAIIYLIIVFNQNKDSVPPIEYAFVIVDQTEDMDNFMCAEAMEQFYEDDNYVYYYSCMKSKYVVVKYANGFEETVEEALKYKSIKISDLDKYGINYYKEPKINTQ